MANNRVHLRQVPLRESCQCGCPGPHVHIACYLTAGGIVETLAIESMSALREALWLMTPQGMSSLIGGEILPSDLANHLMIDGNWAGVLRDDAAGVGLPQGGSWSMYDLFGPLRLGWPSAA